MSTSHNYGSSRVHVALTILISGDSMLTTELVAVEAQRRQGSKRAKLIRDHTCESSRTKRQTSKLDYRYTREMPVSNHMYHT